MTACHGTITFLLFVYELHTKALRSISQHMTIENRMFIYNAFLVSNVSYCNTIWHFCGNRSLYNLEKIHNKALRVVLKDFVSPYRVLLDKVSKPTLCVTRLKAIATEAYKCSVNENHKKWQCNV